MCQELGVMAEGEDRTAVVWMVGVIFGAVGLAAFFLRILARLHVGAKAWGLDDWFMCLAVVSYFFSPVPAVIPLANALSC